MKRTIILWVTMLTLLAVSVGCSRSEKMGIVFVQPPEINVQGKVNQNLAAETSEKEQGTSEAVMKHTEVSESKPEESTVSENLISDSESMNEPYNPVYKQENSESAVTSKLEEEVSVKKPVSESIPSEESEEPIVYCEVCGKISDNGQNGTCIRRKDYICVVCGAETGWLECHTCGEKIVEKPWIPDQAEIDELYLEFKEYVLNLGCTWDDTMDPENASWCGWYESNSGAHTGRTWIERDVKGEIKFAYEQDELTIFHVYIEKLNETQWRFYVLW